MNFKELYQKAKQKAKKIILATTVTGATLAPTTTTAQNSVMDETPDKYKTTITLVNDSVIMRQSKLGYYSPGEKQVFITKDQYTMDDFGFKSTEKEIPEELIIIHERKHETDFKKNKVGIRDMGLYQNYQRDVHVEIVPKIAEALEIRNQYRNAQTPEAKEAVLKRFEHVEDHAEYIQNIRNGILNPDSDKETDFYNEMKFIKENATKLRSSPNDGYRENFEKMSLEYLTTKNLTPNQENFETEVDAMYQIGGIDFTKIGEHKYYVAQNSKIEAAEKMLNQGVSVEKISRFIPKDYGEIFDTANKLDVSGLSQEQAEKVIQTAILSSSLAENIAGDLALNEESNFDFRFISDDLKKPTALYLDIQSDIWKKNNMLTEKGDPEKFSQLMKQAKTIKLDPKSWYDLMKNNIIYDRVGGQKAVLERMKKIDGKIINTDDVIANKDEMVLPLDGTSKEEVITEMLKKEKEEADFIKEYNKTKTKSSFKAHKYSEPYQVTILDMNSSFLKDELELRQLKNQERDQNFEPIYLKKSFKQPTDSTKKNIFFQTYNSADIQHYKNENNDLIDATLINGKRHGLYTVTDKYGNIKEQKLYDQGKEIDINIHKVEIKFEEKNGFSHKYIKLDDHLFGVETFSDNKGNNKVSFWNINGQNIEPLERTQITYKNSELKTKNQNLRKNLKMKIEEKQNPNSPKPKTPRSEIKTKNLPLTEKFKPQIDR